MSQFIIEPKLAQDGRPTRTVVKPVQAKVIEILDLIFNLLIWHVQLIYHIGESIYYWLAKSEPKSVKGEIVLITGTGQGIGKQLALQYAEAGATVVGWDIDQQNNEQTIHEINQKIGNPKAYGYVCNVTNRTDVLETSKKVFKDIGDVTILINNAGIMPARPFLEQTESEIRRTFEINVMGHFWTIEAFLPTMKKKNRGHIVGISSIAGLIGSINLVPYCSSKFAVRGMMESLLQELRLEKNNRIRLTTIYPFMVDTNLIKRAKIRYSSILPLLEPKRVASAILSAQRNELLEHTIPGYLLPMNNIVRNYPYNAVLKLGDLIGSWIDRDP